MNTHNNCFLTEKINISEENIPGQRVVRELGRGAGGGGLRGEVEGEEMGRGWMRKAKKRGIYERRASWRGRIRGDSG